MPAAIAVACKAILTALVLTITCPTTSLAWPVHGTANPCASAPSPAAGQSFCTQTFDISGDNNQWTNTYVSSGTGAGFKLWFDNCLGQTTQPSNTTLSTTSALVGENAGNYQATLSSIVCTGTTPFYHGTAFGGGGYFEVTAAFTAANLNLATWEAPLWMDSIECDLNTVMVGCQWNGQAAGYKHFVEMDVIEHFMGAFSNAITTYQATNHDWYNASRSGNYSTAQTDTPAGGSGSFAVDHRYGMLWVPATSSTDGSACYYYDRVQFYCQTWKQYLNQNEAASQSFTTASTSFTMANPNPGNISAGNTAIDVTAANAVVGTVASYVKAGASDLLDDGGARGTSSASYSVAVTSGIPNGDIIVVRIDEDSGISGSPPTVTDTAGDIFTRDAYCNRGNFETGVSIFHTFTTGLTAGQSVTYHAASGTPYSVMNVSYAANVTATDGTGQCTSTTSGSTSSPSGSITPTQANDLFVGIAAAKAGGTAWTQSTGFTTEPSSWAGGGWGPTIGGYLLESGTTAHNYAPTSSTQPGSTASAMMAFKTAGSSGTPTLTLNSASAINSSGAGDTLLFTETPPPTGQNWAFSIIDNQHLYLETGCMNSPHQCTIKEIQVWQANTSNNLSNP